MNSTQQCCPKCGESLDRPTSSDSVYSEVWGVGAMHEESCDDPITCNCGFFLDENEYVEELGIKDLLEEGCFLDKDGYICYDLKSENPLDFQFNSIVNYTLEGIEEDYGKPHDEVCFFIKGKRPKEFEAFELWNGTTIK